jgi:hypothetical protein
MKPAYSIFLFTCLFAFTVRAQYIDIQTGISIASGSFSNSTLSKNEDGFAKNGWATSISANYLVYQNMGIVTKFSYNTFGFNIDEFSTQVNNQSPQGSSETVTNNGEYKSTSALAGVYLTLGKKKLTIDLRLVAGFISLQHPELVYTTTYSGNTYSRSVESFRDLSPAIGYGFNVKYALPKDFYATCNLDNVNANMQFPKNGYQSSNKDEVTKPYQAYSVTIGIGYKIQ